MAAKLLNLLKEHKGLAVLLLVFVLAIIFSKRDPELGNLFFKVGNLTDMLRVISPVAIMALAMTLVILTAGIDLSVGSIVALSGVVAATLLTKWQSDWVGPFAQIAIAIGCAALAGAAVGLLNGALIAGLRIQPFIVTLAAMIGVRGLTRWFCGNERIGLIFGGDVAKQFGNLFAEKALMIGTFLALAVVFWLLLNKTVFGRYVRACGDNALAARYAGLPVRRVLLAVYALSGLLAGVAGVLQCARTSNGDPDTGIAMELDVIAVVVIGGTSLAGGKGTIAGTIVGALILGVLTSFLDIWSVDSNQQLMLKALIIIIAVALQQKKAAD